MFKITKILSVICVFTLFSTAFAQDNNNNSQNTTLKKYVVIRNSPSFTLLVNLNYSQSALELAGTFNGDFRSEQFMNGETFGAGKGVGGNITGKYSLGDKGNWRALFSLSFNHIQTYLFGSKPTLADQGESSFNAFSFGLGLEDNFTPNHNFKIYAAFELIASMINGKAKMWVHIPPESYNYTYNVKFKNSFRVGYTFGGGTEYMLNENIGLNISAWFSHLNLIGKQTADITNTPAANETIEISLPDGSSKTSALFAGDKNFAFFTIQAGVCFYWGIKEKRYKIGL